MLNCIWCNTSKIEIKGKMLCGFCARFYRVYNRPPDFEELLKKGRRGRPPLSYIKKYGNDFINDIEELKTNFNTTLTSVGKKHGLTKEYIRQVFEDITGEPYTKFLKNKSAKWAKLVKRDKKLLCAFNPKRKLIKFKGRQLLGAVIQNMFAQRCEERGFKVEIPAKAGSNIYVNGYKVVTKSRRKPPAYPNKGSVGYYSFMVHNTRGLDFLACWHATTRKFFIIPKSELGGKKSLTVSIPEKKIPGLKNRYWEYIDRWDLLK